MVVKSLIFYRYSYSRGRQMNFSLFPRLCYGHLPTPLEYLGNLLLFVLVSRGTRLTPFLEEDPTPKASRTN